MTPFDLFAQDTEEVIMLLNYYIEKGNHPENGTVKAEKHGEERIRVNDKTATGGWF